MCSSRTLSELQQIDTCAFRVIVIGLPRQRFELFHPIIPHRGIDFANQLRTKIMDIQSQAQTFIDALHALEQGSHADVAALVALYADDATINNSALDGKNAEMKGTDQITKFWTEYKETLGEVFSKFHHVTQSDNAAGLFWTTEGTNPAGDTVHYHGSTLLQLNDEGKIEFFRGYYDTRELTVKGK